MQLRQPLCSRTIERVGGTNPHRIGFQRFPESGHQNDAIPRLTHLFLGQLVTYNHYSNRKLRAHAASLLRCGDGFSIHAYPTTDAERLARYHL